MPGKSTIIYWCLVVLIVLLSIPAILITAALSDDDGLLIGISLIPALLLFCISIIHLCFSLRSEKIITVVEDTAVAEN